MNWANQHDIYFCGAPTGGRPGTILDSLNPALCPVMRLSQITALVILITVKTLTKIFLITSVNVDKNVAYCKSGAY